MRGGSGEGFAEREGHAPAGLVVPIGVGSSMLSMQAVYDVLPVLEQNRFAVSAECCSVRRTVCDLMIAARAEASELHGYSQFLKKMLDTA